MCRPTSPHTPQSTTYIALQRLRFGAISVAEAAVVLAAIPPSFLYFGRDVFSLLPFSLSFHSLFLFLFPVFFFISFSFFFFHFPFSYFHTLLLVSPSVPASPPRFLLKLFF